MATATEEWKFTLFLVFIDLNGPVEIRRRV